MAELEHIGIAVRDAASALRILEEILDERPYKSESIDQDRIRTHFLRGGGAKLEILESLSPDSPIASYIEKRGGGLHHLAFEVRDVDEAYERVHRLGYRPIDEAPRPGADGKRIFFLHPKGTAGVLIEFCQADRSVLEPVSTSSGMVIRRAGAAGRRLLAYLSEPAAGPDPELLGRRLEQRFSFLAIEARPALDATALAEVLGGRDIHLAAHGRMIPTVLKYAAGPGVDVRSVTLCEPERGKMDGDLDTPTLIIGRDDAGLEIALSLRASLRTSRLAVLPVDDATLVAQLIEEHAYSV